MMRHFREAGIRFHAWTLPFSLPLVSVLLAGCLGGSGSSGFDISPSAERALIERTIDEARCFEFGSTVLCPTDESDLLIPVPGNIPAPPIEGVSLATGVARDTGFPCSQVTQAKCIIRIALTAVGLPEGSWLQVVWRQDGDSGPWRIRQGEPLQSDGRTEITVELPVECTSVQVAALVYTDGQVLAGGHIATLSDAAAEISFVMAPLPVFVEPAP